jgi:hypothetical protein
VGAILSSLARVYIFYAQHLLAAYLLSLLFIFPSIYQRLLFQHSDFLPLLSLVLTLLSPHLRHFSLMATVHGPPIAQHPIGRSHNIPRSRVGFQPATTASTQQAPKPDAFYGHEYIARLCARFITHLFACPEYPPQPPNGAPHPASAKLPYFIAYALHRTKLHQSVNYAALVLLQRLKARFPTARGSSGHRLFISAFMIASKVMCDDTYSNKSWGIVAQGMFSLREINQMEREMCSYLEWELTVDATILKNFETMVRKDFNGQGPYPTYVMSMFSSRKTDALPPSHAAVPPNSSTSPIPMFGNTHSSTPPPPPKTPYEHQKLQQVPLRKPVKVAASMPRYPSPPNTPPSPFHSDSSSPTSSTSSDGPVTPTGDINRSVGIVSAGSSPLFTMEAFAKKTIPVTHPLKPKMFAFAESTGW